MAWFAGDNDRAEREAQQAIELLEPLPEGRELAMAYSNMAQLRMLSSDRAGTYHWGMRAIALAERLDELEIEAHALNNVGTAELEAGSRGGIELLEKSLSLALGAGLEEHVARAHTNLGAVAFRVFDYTLADRHLDAGIAYCTEHDLDSWVDYMLGWKARSELDQGQWDEAMWRATTLVQRPDVAVPSRITPLVVVGLLRARRGDPEPFAPLDEALELARRTGELQRLAPVSAARAEAHWLGGGCSDVDAETAAALAEAVERRDGWATGLLATWRRRCGLSLELDHASVPEPFRLELQGDLEAAAERWAAIGCPYEAAVARALAGDGDAAAALQGLGARRAWERVGARER